MPTLFTKIIDGDLPGRFVWKDEHCVSFLTIQPLRPGHILVVPRQEVDHWIDLDDELAGHLMRSSKVLGHALQRAFPATKVGLKIVGLEVPHVHIHLVPIDEIDDLDFARAKEVSAEEMDCVARQIREALKELGRSEVTDQ